MIIDVQNIIFPILAIVITTGVKKSFKANRNNIITDCYIRERCIIFESIISYSSNRQTIVGTRYYKVYNIFLIST